MIRNIKLYKCTGGYLDISSYKLLELEKGSILCSTIPICVDITTNKLIIYFKGNNYSFARPYDYEKVYVSKHSKKNQSETFEPFCYKITFNNPHDSEKRISGYITLTWFQNIVFSWYRLRRWLKEKDNILWIINILVLILNIICGILCFK